MIRVENLVKEYTVDGRIRKVLDGISFEVGHGERVALLGMNGSGKSTLIRLLAKVELPTCGSITQTMSLSWPIGFHTGMQGSLSGFDNIRFVSRIYDQPYDKVRDYVEEFSELGAYLKMPVKTYSAGMTARLAFGLSLAIEFDCYLIDEVLAVGDFRFHQKCIERLLGPKAKGGFILATHVAELAQEFCSRALVMRQGKARMFDLKTGLDVYRGL